MSGQSSAGNEGRTDAGFSVGPGGCVSPDICNCLVLYMSLRVAATQRSACKDLSKYNRLHTEDMPPGYASLTLPLHRDAVPAMKLTRHNWGCRSITSLSFGIACAVPSWRLFSVCSWVLAGFKLQYYVFSVPLRMAFQGT